MNVNKDEMTLNEYAIHLYIVTQIYQIWKK